MSDALLNALRRKVVTYKAAGRLDLVAKCEARIAERQASAVDRAAPPEPAPWPDPAEPESSHAEYRGDGIHAVGGGWYEVVVDGKVMDKLRGSDAAQAAYDAYTEAD